MDSRYDFRFPVCVTKISKWPISYVEVFVDQIVLYE